MQIIALKSPVKVTRSTCITRYDIPNTYLDITKYDYFIFWFNSASDFCMCLFDFIRESWKMGQNSIAAFQGVNHLFSF